MNYLKLCLTFIKSSQAPQNLDKICKDRKGRQPFLLVTFNTNGCVETITLVIDKIPLMTFKESPAAIVALIGSHFIFDLTFPSESAGIYYFIEKFVAQMPVRSACKYATYQNSCIGILSNKELQTKLLGEQQASCLHKM